MAPSASPPGGAVRPGLWRLVRLAPASTALTTAWVVLAAAGALLVPAVSGRAVDAVLTGRGHGAALAALAGLLALRLVAEACGGVSRVDTTTRVQGRLRYALLRHVFALGVPGARRYPTGDLVTRLTANAATAAGAVPALVNAAVATGTSLVGLIALCVIDWRLAVVFVLGVAPAMLLLRRLMSQVTGAYTDYLTHVTAIAARLTDALAGSRTIRASGTAQREIARTLAPLPELTKAGMRTWEVQRNASWQVGLVLTAVRVAVLLVAGISVAQRRITPGEFLASSLYLTFALGFVSQADNLLRIGHAAANARRVHEVLAEQPQVGPEAGHERRATGLPPGPGALSLRGVSVRIADQTVLDRVDLDVPAGAAVAVVGRSGSGKTTLALLVGRLLDADAGRVLIDGAPTDAVEPAGLRREVAYAFDRPVLLGETVRQALTYGVPHAAGSDVEQAVRLAQAGDFIQRLPGGLDTPLADAPVSGGELQRLGLARAIAHGGRVLVLDDATSSLDTVTEARVADALSTGLAGRTRLIIAHRATTAARADLVAWLDGERIRALTPHDILWDTEPEYRAVFAADSAALDSAALDSIALDSTDLDSTDLDSTVDEVNA